MYKILRKEKLNPTVTRMEILAPEVAAKAERASSSSCVRRRTASASR